MDAKVAKPKIVPFSLKDAPSLIERIWPAQKISVEAQKERKANAGQTLTPLGTYWKGRKPLALIRACILGALLPATGDDETDLEMFECLVGLSDAQVRIRMDGALTAEEVVKFAPELAHDFIDAAEDKPRLIKMSRDERADLFAKVLCLLPYSDRVQRLHRAEEIDESELTGPFIDKANLYYGTSAHSLPDLVQQLGVMRFGRAPVVGDTFSGGGSIPFEAARLGANVFASDLNPVACMLTWGALNIIGADETSRVTLEQEQMEAFEAVNREITALKIEHDSLGNRAKAYLYCMETKCPSTGWLVPLSPTWVVSKGKKVVAQLIPDRRKKRFDIKIVCDASPEDLKTADLGTVRDGRMVYELDGETYSTPIKSIRGDRKESNGESANNLRLWDKMDIVPRATDIFQERLYCIQWIDKDEIEKSRPRTFFAAPTDADLKRERQVEAIVSTKLAQWQADGLVPDIAIERGEKTDEPIRTRGWTHWHHLFFPRALLTLSLLKARSKTPAQLVLFAKTLDYASRCCRWVNSPGVDAVVNTFDNQALNVQWNPGLRALERLGQPFTSMGRSFPINVEQTIKSAPCNALQETIDIFVTDPPYADAVVYHEITEFFIAWLRKDPPPPFNKWVWDSRRPLAIKGEGDDFRHNMVSAYKTMTEHMPDNGLQIVMFTHQSAAVWADMAQIFWGAGLQVMAAWYIATETTSDLKKGGYVQGTVILVLRKRRASEAGYKDEVVQEVKAEVADQIDTMVGLNQSLKGTGRIENLFEDADLQMAGYAAALRVLTKYEKIDGTDMTKEALRPRRVGEKNIVGDIIDFAVQVANEHMVPEHMTPKLWEDLSGAERFYFKMMDIETTSLRKLDNYQNFAKAFRVGDYGALMGTMEPNKAMLKTAKEFKKAGFEIPEFGPSATRAALYAIFELENDVEGDDVLSHLKDNMQPNYHNKRDDLAAIADYIARKREIVDETESRAARILHGLIRNERLG